MSTVYLAKDKNLGSYWAVKQVNGEVNTDIDSFKKEVELLSTLQHSDIPRIVDRVEIGKDYFVVMDFVDGTSLGKKVDAEGPQKEKNVIEWAKMLCDVLDYLHHARVNPIIYRDMKPDNVMLMQSGRVKLIDFGIAKECERGKKVIGPPVGTRGYAAPEQYKNSSNILDERTDIYSLGCTIYYLLTAITPGKPPNGLRPLRQINPLLSEGIEYIVKKCTNVNPPDRYQNCRELKRDLENIYQFNSSYKKKMRNKILLCAGSLAASIAFFVLTVVGYNGIEAVKEDNYQTAYQTAIEYDRKGDYINAAKYYREAIGYKGSDYETYISLFNTLLPHSADDEERESLIKSAIDEMRTSYIDNGKSNMYHNTMLMYQVVTKGMDVVNDPTYAKYLLEYIKLIQQSNEYKSNEIDKIRVDSYYVITSNCADDLTTKNFVEFGNALSDLAKTTESYNMEAEEKVKNYFTVLRIYCTYATKIDGAYDKIIEISDKAQSLIEEAEINIVDESSEELSGIDYTELVSMYKTLANRLYSGAKATTTDINKQQQLYQNSLKWFDLLDIYDVYLGTDLNIIKGNCYKGLYDTYASLDNPTDENIKYLELAVSVYRDVLEEDSKNFSARVYLAQALLSQESISHNNSRLSEIKSLYNQLKQDSANANYTEKTLFNALKEAMKMAGMEV